MTEYVVGMGANLGDRLGTLNAAVLAISRIAGAHVVEVSSIYETAALGPPAPDFLNGAVLLEAELSPPLLLKELLRIEAEHGRVRRERWGPRTLDLDILWKSGAAYETADLCIPHAYLLERPFALAPLFDVLKDADWARQRCEQLGGIPRKIGTLSRP